MTNVLITNDDGVHAPGLLALKQALEDLGRIMVVAPERNWSAAGHTKTMHKPLRIRQVTLSDGTLAYATSGTPSDCVGLALLGAVPFEPDLVVSGVNDGPNLGHDVTYSGTVAGAMEAAVAELPALAISLDYGVEADPLAAAAYAAKLVRQVQLHGLPRNTFLNVNVPALPYGKIQGMRLTRLGQRVYKDLLIERRDPRNRPYYWIGGELPSGLADQGTDIAAIQEGCVSVTPLTMDMTDYALLDAMRSWNLVRDDGQGPDVRRTPEARQT